MKLTPEQRDQHLIELKVAVIGMEGEEDGGLVGDIKDVKAELKRLNGSVRTNTTFRKLGTWIGSAVVLLVIGTCVKILCTGSVA